MYLFSSLHRVTARCPYPVVAALSVFLLISACGGGSDSNVSNDVSKNNAAVRFAAKVGNDAFSCGSSYTIGANNYRVDDLRLYVYDLTLTTDVGGEIPVTLNQDGEWQYQNVAHLDFENATADACNGNDATNNTITGTYEGPTEGNIVGLCFNLGVPYEYNHSLTSQNADSPAPLNVTGMSWVWLAGHKFFKLDGVGDPGGLNTNFHVHVGSTGCSNASGDKNQVPDSECTYPNTPRICLDSFDMASQAVTIDIGALLADSDVTVNAGGAAGCMSGNNDPECPAIMPKFGIDYTFNDGVNPPTDYPAIDPQPVFGVAGI
jgi:uncharacterized repeat protein (TIGR04052 family)